MSESAAPAKNEITLIRIQAAAGLLFSIFLAIHLFNTMAGAGGPEAYDGFQSGARAFYQNPVVEGVIVLIPLLVHLGVSILRIVRRRGRALARPPLRLRLHRYTGWFLLFVIGGHVTATRGVGYFFDAPASFGALNFSITLLPYLFIPYYTMLGTFGLYHMTNGLTIALRVFGVRLPAGVTRGPGFWVPVATGSALIVAAVLAFSGAFQDVPRESWGRFGEVYAELTGASLDDL